MARVKATLEANLLDTLLDFDAPLRRAVFLTYSFDPDYFVDTVYPELRRRRCERVLILMDATQYAALHARGDLPGDGRLIVEHYHRGVLFHPKVFVLAGGAQEAGSAKFRAVVGSANLTRAGFELNRELFSVLNEQNGDIAGLVDLLQQVARRLPAGTAAEILHETVAELRAAKPEDAGSPIAPIIANGIGRETLWQQLEIATAGAKLRKAVVLSPYFESPDNFDKGLLDQLLSQGLNVDLYVPFQQGISRVPREELKTLAARYPGKLNLFGVQTGGRLLHGKLIGQMSRSRAWILTGSANYTAGGLTGDNVEACQLFSLRRDEAEAYLDQLLATCSKLITTDQLPQPQGYQGPPVPSLTGFLISAVLSIRENCLTITLDRPLSQISANPADLVVQLGGQSTTLAQLPPEDIGDLTFVVRPASTYLQEREGDWRVGTVILRSPDGSAEDWRLIELAPGEVLDDTGTPLAPADDLETYVARLLNPQAIPGAGTVSGPKQPTSKRDQINFEDVEGALDRAYRYAGSLMAHYARLVTDPYTIHRWRSDWLNLATLLEKAQDLGSSGRALIASRLLSHIDEQMAKDEAYAHQALDNDHALLESLRRVNKLAASAPGFSITTLEPSLAEAAE